MFAVIVLIFEVIAIIFIGIFARSTDNTISSTTYGVASNTLFSQSLILLLGFTFMYSPFRKLSIFAFVSLLLVISIAAQTNILFGTFWDGCFNGFSSSFQITGNVLMRSAFACLSVLLTVLDFVGLFDYWQVYLLIAPIMTIGYSLCSAIIIYGLKTFDGGGGVGIFLYSGMCSLMIWALSIRGKIDSNRYIIKQSYVNQMLGFIGVVMAFINWPSFNMAGATISSINSLNTTTNVISLRNSAYPNTFIGLSGCILLSILFASKETKEQKLKYKVYIDGFINSGIVIASFQDLTLHPVACLIVSGFTNIFTVIIHKYFLTPSETESEGIFKKMMRNYGKIFYRIVFSLIGSIIAAIVVASRDGQSPALLTNNYSKIAGFQMVAWILVAILGAAFGVITAISINTFLQFKKSEAAANNQGQVKMIEIADSDFFEGFLYDQIHPLYYDIFDQIDKQEKEKINLADYTTRVIKESLLVAQDNPLRMMSVIKKQETKADPRETRMVIQKDFSKSNFKNSDVSKMKIYQNEMEGRQDDEEVRQKEEVVNPDKEMRIQKSKLKITEGETVPKPKDQDVRRKLNFEESEVIRDERFEKSKVRQ